MLNRSAKILRLITARLLALGLVLVLFLLSFLSASNALHRFFHHGEPQGASPCAVCLLVKGHLESPAPAPTALIPAPRQVSVSVWTVTVQPAVVFLSTLSRAPPVLTTLLSVAV